jgi:hypothetical protein
MVVGLALTGLVGCSKPQGSCDRRADRDKTCTDVLASTIKDSSKADCAKDPVSHAKGTWSDGACEHDSAIAGCESSNSRTWYFPGGRVSKPEHVAQLCSAPGDKLVDAKGKKLTDVKAEKLPGEFTDRQVEDFVTTVTPQLESVLTAVSKIKAPSSAPSGAIRPSGGKAVEAPAATVYESDLSALGVTTTSSTETYPLKGGNDLRACAAAVRLKKRLDGYTAESVESALAWCPKIRYLLVVRLTKFTAADSHNGLQFKGGAAEGQVFAFEVPSGTPIGGYSFKAQSSEKVKSNEIEKDLRENIAKALDAGLKKASPTATLHFDF